MAFLNQTRRVPTGQSRGHKVKPGFHIIVTVGNLSPIDRQLVPNRSATRPDAFLLPFCKLARQKKTPVQKFSIDLIVTRVHFCPRQHSRPENSCFHVQNYIATIGDRSSTPEKVNPISTFLRDRGIVGDPSPTSAKKEKSKLALP